MKYNNTQKAILKEFESDVKDQELQKRYNGFLSSKEHYEKSYESFVAEYNVLANRKRIISGALIELVKIGQKVSEEAVQELIDIDAKLKKTSENIGIVEKEKSYYEDLIKRYKASSENKLFWYWKIFKAANIIDQEWLMYKVKYTDKIF